MKINSVQKFVLSVAVLIVSGICLYPPRYYEIPGANGNHIVPASYIKSLERRNSMLAERAYPLIESQRYLLILGVALAGVVLIFLFSKIDTKLPDTISSGRFLSARIQVARKSKKISKALLVAAMLIVGSITLAFMRTFHLNGVAPVFIVFTPFFWVLLKMLNKKTAGDSGKEVGNLSSRALNQFQIGLDCLKRNDRSKALEQVFVLQAMKKNQEAEQLRALIMKSADRVVIKLMIGVTTFVLIYFVVWYFLK